jgi:hypothetical protein
LYNAKFNKAQVINFKNRCADTTSMKSFRLIVHQKNFSVEDLIINPKDYPGANLGDIVEIYHPPPDDDNPRSKKKTEPEEEYPRLLLQIKTFPDDSTQQNALQKGSLYKTNNQPIVMQ